MFKSNDDNITNSYNSLELFTNKLHMNFTY